MRLTNRSAPGLLAIAMMLVACGTPGPSQSASSPSLTAPSPSPSPSASPSTPPSTPPSPSASTSSGSATSGSVKIDDAVTRSVALPWPATDPRPLAVVGPRAYYVGLISGRDSATGKMNVPFVYRLHVADVATGSRSDVLTLAPGHMITSALGGFAATAGHLYWVEIWYDGLPNLDEVGGNAFGDLPQQWQIVGFDLARGSRAVIASGTNHRVAVEGAGAAINPPVLAVDVDRLAYTLEATTPDAPNGNKIVLRSLADGKIVGTLTTTGFVPWVGLAGPVVAYREALATNLDGSSVRDARLMLRTFTADAGAIGSIDEHISDAAISGDRLVWGRTDATDGSAWTTPLSGGVPVHIAGPTGVGFVQGSETGSGWVRASDGFATWTAPGTVNGSDQSAVPFIWQTGDRAARLLIMPAAVDAIEVSGGWLTWDESDGGPPRLWGVALGQVTHTP